MIELRFTDNRISSIPSTIGKLTQLRELHAARNDLNELPASIGSLGNLRKLNLEANRLTALPSSIGNLGQLFELNLRGNRVTRLAGDDRELSQAGVPGRARERDEVACRTRCPTLPLEKLDLRWNSDRGVSAVAR